MKIIAFIGSDTGQTLTNARFNNVTVYRKPRNLYDPNPEGEVIVVLHVTQPNDNDPNQITDFKCFSACVKALCDGDTSDPDYQDHQCWIDTHRQQIAGLVLTSGATIHTGNDICAAALNELSTKKPRLAFKALRVDELIDIIGRYDLLAYLRGVLWEEVALKFVVACQCYLWQRFAPVLVESDTFEWEVISKLVNYTEIWRHMEEAELLKQQYPNFDHAFEQLANRAASKDEVAYFKSLQDLCCAFFPSQELSV